MNRQLVLASGSEFRRQLLEKLHLPFEFVSPDIDESIKEKESAKELVMRLALEKAQAVRQEYPDALIIGSDQVALLNGEILGKPNTHERALAQLKAASGKSVLFLTGLAVFDSATEIEHSICEPYRVRFRELADEQIDTYLRLERPYQCAGAFKSEGLGIVLFEHFEGDDPNALIGLPLIQLVNLLAKFDEHII